MNLTRWLKTTFSVSLILLILSIGIHAQDAPVITLETEDIPKVTFVRQTASGAVIVSMGGKQYRLLSADEFRQALIDREKVKTFESIQRNEAVRLAELNAKRKLEIESLVADYELNLKNLREQVANAEKRADNSETKFEKQKQVQKRTFVLTVTNTVMNVINFLLKIFK